MNFSIGKSAYSKVLLVGVDQLISATGNFLVVWLCLTSLPTGTFGSFSYAWNSISLFIILGRALFGVPALLDSQTNGSEATIDISASLTGSSVLGVLAGLTTLILYVSGGISESNTWIFGLFLLCPMILFQDSIRYLMIAMARVKVALLLDILLLTCILSFVIFAKRHEFLGWNLILTMACGYAIASAIFVTINPIHPSLRKLNTLIRFDFHRRSRLLADSVISWAFGILSLTLIRIATGDEGIGMFNKIIFLFGPVTLLTVFISLGLQSEVMRTKDHLAPQHKALLFSLCLIPIIWFNLITRVPDHLLATYMGLPTPDLFTYVKPFAVWSSLGLGIEILILFMRGSGKFGEIVIIRFTGGVIMLISFVVLLAAKSSLELFIWAGAVSNFIILFVTIGSLRRANITDAFTQQGNSLI